MKLLLLLQLLLVVTLVVLLLSLVVVVLLVLVVVPFFSPLSSCKLLHVADRSFSKQLENGKWKCCCAAACCLLHLLPNPLPLRRVELLACAGLLLVFLLALTVQF